MSKKPITEAIAQLAVHSCCVDQLVTLRKALAFELEREARSDYVQLLDGNGVEFARVYLDAGARLDFELSDKRVTLGAGDSVRIRGLVVSGVLA